MGGERLTARVDKTRWPGFARINAAMQTYLGEVEDRILADALQGDSSEVAEVAEPPKLAAGTSRPVVVMGCGFLLKEGLRGAGMGPDDARPGTPSA